MEKIKLSIEDKDGIKNFEYQMSNLINEYAHNPILYRSVNQLAEYLGSQHFTEDFPIRLLYLTMIKIKENKIRRNNQFKEFVEKEKELGKRN